jgi:transposase
MRKVAYLGLDAHAGNCVLGEMDSKGNYRGDRCFPTSERNIIDALKVIKAKEKYLALEEGNLAFWVAQIAKPYVTEVICCDPKENALIFRSPNKRDKVDVQKLCRLLRMGELKQVYQAENDDRAIFKAAALHYIDLREHQTAVKQKIKAMYQHWGVLDIGGEGVYSAKQRDGYLKRIKHLDIRRQMKRLYSAMDHAVSLRDDALKALKRLGRKYSEIKEFQKIPGVGEIGAHLFDAIIQTPHRFAHRSQLWRYCRLGVTEYSSDGKQLGFKRLDKSGIAEIKCLTFLGWMNALKRDNEVRRFYKASLKRTCDRVHARLNTQRKMIAVMYGIWRKGEEYNPELFLGSADIVALYD